MLHAEVNRQILGNAYAFLDSLNHKQVRACVLPFNSAARMEWSYLPGERPGLFLRDMDARQRRLALDFIRTALSDTGFATARGIMALEEVLREREPGEEYGELNYAVAIFGNPTASPPWAWRIDGHHLSITFTIGLDDTIVASPHFMGANPAAFDPAHRIHGVLGAEEDLARAFVRGLDARQRARAVFAADAPRDVLTGPGREGRLRTPTGLPLSDLLDDVARQAVVDLLAVYAGRLRPELAEDEMERIRAAGPGNLHFAWAGGLEPGQPHYYRIHGPTVVVEYDNTQNGANHIHTVWHDPGLDFGRDLLREHLEEGH